jgi:hypothetical protein
MPEKWTRDEIRAAFALWLKRCEGKDIPDADDPDVLADYLVELMREAGKQ